MSAQINNNYLDMENGYYWFFDPVQGWINTYHPIPNQYTPPIHHPGLNYGYFYFHPEHTSIMGSIIGKDGFHFKNITKMSGCVYIYAMDNKAEIWGTDEDIDAAFELMANHVQHQLDKKNRESQDISIYPRPINAETIM